MYKYFEFTVISKEKLELATPFPLIGPPRAPEFILIADPLVRNLRIIAHIDHGKSTLSGRFLGLDPLDRDDGGRYPGGPTSNVLYPSFGPGAFSEMLPQPETAWSL